MNRTVTINISGIIFHIEEDAYQNLSAYLSALKQRFSAIAGGAEILSDVEARIAELMQERITPGKQVLVNGDVEYAKATMGSPEDFGAEEPGPSREKPRAEEAGPVVKRRFFRDPEDKVFGGVCSGLAAYFDIDRVWVRLAMFILIFFGGLSLWVYIILWIVIPEARTTADRLAMQGRPANLNSIVQNFREEAEDVKDRMSRYGSELNRNYGDRVRDNVSGFLTVFFNIIGRIIGFLFVAMGIALLIGYVVVITGVSLFDMNSDVANWKTAIFESGLDYSLALLAFIIVAGIPVFALLYHGMKLLFRITYSNRWLGLVLGLTWVFGIILAVYVGVKTGQQFAERTSVKETVDLGDTGDTILVAMKPTPQYYPEGSSGGDGDENGFGHGNIRLGESGKSIRIVGAPGIDVMESHNGKAQMVIEYESRGVDKRDAYMKAKAIRYHFERDGDRLVFDENFIIEEDIKYRKPRVHVRLMLPVGKVINFDHSVKNFLDDVENTTNTWDGDMAGRRWKMTAKGLECVDCENLDSFDHAFNDGHPRRRKAHVKIGHDGIHIRDNKDEVKIDGDGIRVNSEEE